MSVLQIPTAEVYEPLLDPARYKGADGGRGSGKSHFFAGLGIEDALRFPGEAGTGLLMVCIREVQKTLQQSAKRLIEAKLHGFGLGEKDGFKLFRDVIEFPGDGLCIFQGMQDHTADSIKSLEGFHRAWCEESQTLSSRSLELLRPTIRWEDKDKSLESELWFSWNARRKVDPVDKMFKGGKLPTGAVYVKANWSDNPWFPEVLNQERLDCLENNPDQYNHIWEGDYVTVAEGAYFAKRMAEAKKSGRLIERPHVLEEDPLMTIRLFADIGGTGAKADNFVFWAAQFIGPFVNVLNHYEAQGQEIGHHLHWLHENGYVPGRAQIWLPHDGVKSDSVYKVTYRSAFEEAGYDVIVVPNQGAGAAMARIEALRRIFPRMYFDKHNCQGGLDALGWYHPKVDEQRQIDLGPDHDWSSHSADSAGLMAVVYETPDIGSDDYILGDPDVNRDETTGY